MVCPQDERDVSTATNQQCAVPAEKAKADNLASVPQATDQHEGHHVCCCNVEYSADNLSRTFSPNSAHHTSNLT